MTTAKNQSIDIFSFYLQLFVCEETSTKCLHSEWWKIETATSIPQAPLQIYYLKFDRFLTGKLYISNREIK